MVKDIEAQKVAEKKLQRMNSWNDSSDEEDGMMMMKSAAPRSYARKAKQSSGYECRAMLSAAPMMMAAAPRMAMAASYDIGDCDMSEELQDECMVV